jgi:hypothetical protein
MTIVKIEKDQKDIVAKIAAEFNIGCQFFTMENNDRLLQAQFDTDNQVSLFHLGKGIGHAVTCQDWCNSINKIM